MGVCELDWSEVVVEATLHSAPALAPGETNLRVSSVLTHSPSPQTWTREGETTQNTSLISTLTSSQNYQDKISRQTQNKNW